MKEERQELSERGARLAAPNFSLKIIQVWIIRRAATSKKFHIPFQFLDLDTLLVLSIHSTALIKLNSDGFVLSSIGIAQSTEELAHPSFHYFLGWLKVNEWLIKDYKGRFSLPQFEATLSSQFQSSTYNSVKSQTQLHYRSVFLVAHSCEFFFFFFHSCTCKEHSATNHLFSTSESVLGARDLKLAAYSVRMQGESPWTTNAFKRQNDDSPHF